MKKPLAILLALLIAASAFASGSWTYNGDGTATDEAGVTVILGFDGVAGTSDDNTIINPKGTVLLRDVELSYDGETPCVELGNGFSLYPGKDGKIGTQDDIVKGFGSYPQSDVTGETKDPLNWRILDIKDGVCTLMAEYSLNAVFFNLSETDGIDWEGSNVRAWLNSRGGVSFKGDTEGFYDAAFSAEEKEKIVLSYVRMDYSDWPLWNPTLDRNRYDGATGTYPAYNKVKQRATGLEYPWDLLTTYGASTYDYVYLLSGEELFLYFGDPDYALLADACPLWHPINYTNAYFTCTPYALMQGAKYNGGTQVEFFYNADSWLRSPGVVFDGISYGAFLGTNGDIDTGREVNCVQKSKDDGHEITYGVIPLIQVKLY